jgi:hypothetical protein
MKIVRWIKIGLILLPLAVLVSAYLGPCNSSIAKCFFGNYILVARTLVHFSLALLIMTPIVFFVSNYVMIRWIYFSVLWFLISGFLIFITPVSTGGWVSFGPEKFFVSMFMSSLFVVVSTAKLIWDVRKEKITSKATQ